MPPPPDDATLVDRVCWARRAAYGEDGVARLAGDLSISAESWEGFERGEIIPATILLGFLRLTGVRPRWLLTGDGPEFHRPDRPIGRG